MEFINVQVGTSPLVISVPHAGTMIPAEIKQRMQPDALFLPDTDWFVDKLYTWAPAQGASMIVTPWSRYVIDLNRPPDDKPLYDRPGSSLVPTSSFCGIALYRDGEVPGESEIGDRLERYWSPYHQHLAEVLKSTKAVHGYAVLLDGHSIRSEVPGLFDGKLPHLNLGSNDGLSADPSLIDASWEVLRQSRFDAVRDGRFKGGYITRHYGRPGDNIHALQLEIAQRAYMPESPPQWDRAKAEMLVELLKRLVPVLQEWKPGSATDRG